MAAVAVSMNAAAGDWLTVADFESNVSTPVVWDIYNNPKGTVEVKTVANGEESENQAAVYSVSDGGYNSAIEITVTLPGGMTIADYDAIDFDIYNYEMTWKPLFIYINDTIIKEKEGNDQGDTNAWHHEQHAINITDDANEIKIRIGYGIQNDSFALDNIRLREKGEGGDTPVIPDPVGDWSLVADFENNAAIPTLWNRYNEETVGTIEVKTVATDSNSDNQAAVFTGGNWNTAMEITVTLPEGKTIADYDAIDFDIFNFNMSYKPMFIYIDNTLVKDSNGNDEGNVNAWHHVEYPINLTGDADVMKIRIGYVINGSSDSFAVDNIRLHEKDNGGDTPVEPIDYYETANGTMSDNGTYMVNDFQHHAAPAVVLPTWGRGGNGTKGKSVTAHDPEDKQNLVAHMSGESNYETLFDLDVTLPEGKSINDFSFITFDLYRNSSDSNHKKMHLYVNDDELYVDSDWIEQAPVNEWTEKFYEIPAAEAVMAKIARAAQDNNIKLRLGIESDAPDYMIDNVRLTTRDNTTGIQNVADSDNVKIFSTSTGFIVSANAVVNVYRFDGSLVESAAVNGSRSFSLAPGLYIVKAGSTVKKIVIK